MQTTADKKIIEVKEHITNAIKKLHEVLVEDCHGFDGYTSSYKFALAETQHTLIDIKLKLEQF